MTPDEVRQQIELKIVELIKNGLVEGTITEERSKDISSWVLKCLTPGMNFTAFYKALPKLDDTFPELSPIVVPYLRDYENNVVQKARSKAEDFIQQGKYDAAVKLTKDAIDYNLNVVMVGAAKPN